MSKAPKPLRRPRNSVSVTFEFIQLDETGGNQLVLNGAIDNHECRMVIDTGASRTVADLGFIQKVFPSITIGEKTLGPQLLVVLDLGHVNQTYKALGIPEVQIILGSDLLKASKAIIDYGGKQLILG